MKSTFKRLNETGPRNNQYFNTLPDTENTAF